MSDLPFINFYASDFLAGTSGLSAAERGVYITLLCLMWENDGPVRRDDARLARRCGLPKAGFVKVLGALMDEEKIIEEGGHLTNRRAEKSLMTRQIRSQNSTIAARKRWSAQNEKGEQNQEASNADALPGQSRGNANQNQNQIYGGGGGSAGAREAENQPSENEPDPTFRERLIVACRRDPAKETRMGQPAEMIVANRWVTDLGLTEDEIVDHVAAIVANKRDGPPETLTYFTKPLARYAAQLGAARSQTIQPTEITHDAGSNTVRFPRPPRGSRSGTSLADVAARLIAESGGEG